MDGWMLSNLCLCVLTAGTCVWTDGERVLACVLNCVCLCVLTVGKALGDRGSRIREGATLPLDVALMNSPQETMVTLICHTLRHQRHIMNPLKCFQKLISTSVLNYNGHTLCRTHLWWGGTTVCTPGRRSCAPGMVTGKTGWTPGPPQVAHRSPSGFSSQNAWHSSSSSVHLHVLSGHHSNQAVWPLSPLSPCPWSHWNRPRCQRSTPCQLHTHTKCDKIWWNAIFTTCDKMLRDVTRCGTISSQHLTGNTSLWNCNMDSIFAFIIEFMLSNCTRTTVSWWLESLIIRRFAGSILTVNRSQPCKTCP